MSTDVGVANQRRAVPGIRRSPLVWSQPCTLAPWRRVQVSDLACEGLLTASVCAAAEGDGDKAPQSYREDYSV